MIATESGTVAQPTRNVSYVGTVGDLGPSVYMQGTHMLTLADGQFILLESTDANLNLSTYLGKHVEVRGSVQSTVEGNGTIMRVEEVTLLETSESSSETSTKAHMCGGIAGIQCKNGKACVDNPSDNCDPKNGGADCSGICVETSSSSSTTVLGDSSSSSSKTTSSVASVMKSSAAVSSAVSSKTTSSAASSVAPVSSSEAMINHGAQESVIVLMAKQTYGQENLWTQKYCTNHIAFCIPAHKNWYFKSFGATTNNLWHVEFSMSSIDELYQGPIVLNLVSGTSAAAGATDGQVKTQGSDVVGYKDWNDSTHFELIGDSRLKEAVSYMLSHVAAYTPGE